MALQKDIGHRKIQFGSPGIMQRDVLDFDPVLLQKTEKWERPEKVQFAMFIFPMSYLSFRFYFIMNYTCWNHTQNENLSFLMSTLLVDQTMKSTPQRAKTTLLSMSIITNLVSLIVIYLTPLVILLLIRELSVQAFFKYFLSVVDLRYVKILHISIKVIFLTLYIK